MGYTYLMTALLQKVNSITHRLPQAELEKVLQFVEGLEKGSSAQQPCTGTSESIGQKLAVLARRVESEPCDLPDDLASNHDHYLHGLNKRR